MSPFEYIQQKVYTKLKPSSYNGIGVFALRDIPKDTFIFETWQGTSGTFEISEEELNTLPIQLKEHIKDIFLFQVDLNFEDDFQIYLILNRFQINFQV